MTKDVKSKKEITLRVKFDKTLKELRKLDHDMSYWRAIKFEYFNKITQINEKLCTVEFKRNEMDKKVSELRTRVYVK